MKCKKSKLDFTIAVKTLGLDGQLDITTHNVYNAMVAVIATEGKLEDQEHLFACLEAGLWLMCKHFEQYISVVRTIRNNISSDIKHPFVVKFIALVVANSDLSKEDVEESFMEKQHKCDITRTGYIQSIF